MPRSTRAALRCVLALLVLAATGTALALAPLPASAEGSRDLYPAAGTCSATGTCRAAIEWRTNSYGPSGSTIIRRTLFTVFAKSGETLDLGSSAVGTGSADIVVWNPDRVTDDQAATLPVVTSGTDGFSCSAQRTATGSTTAGKITTRAQELAGPQAVTGGANAAGYVPCHYTVPSTGLYKVAFYGPAGSTASSDGAPTGDVGLGSANNFSATQGTSVAAWDITLRDSDTSTADITGRVFTYALAAFTGGNARPIDQTLYATTLDGYVYRADTNGLDPNGFVIYGNEAGFLDPQGDPLNHDVLGNGSQMNVVQGGVSLAAPEYPISFHRLSEDTLTAIGVDDSPVAPVLSHLAFEGANTGRSVYVGHAGTFTFDQNVHGTYSLVISRDGTDYDPGKPTNRVLRGVADAGSQSVVWDGKDNAGNPFPAGHAFLVRAEERAGVYHFPLLDAENSLRGGPSFTLLNPPGGTCPFGNAACTTSFYDDRGYHTSAGDVGTPGQSLPGNNAPTVDHTDAFTGYDSTTAQRAYGSAGASTGFGDAKGLDSWTYFPSTTQYASLDILPLPAVPTADDDSGTTSAGHALVVPAGQGLLSGDTGTELRVGGHTSPGHGSVAVDGDGGWTYTPATGYVGSDSFDYTAVDAAGQTATAHVTVTVVVGPVATDDTASTAAGETLTRPASSGLLTNDSGATLEVDSHTAPAHGTLSVGPGGGFSYTPEDGFSGTDSFDYTAVDAYGATDSATVLLDVTPAAHDDAVTTSANTTLEADAAHGVLADDEGAGLTVSSHTAPAHGTLVSLGAGGGYRYEPQHDFSGTDSFEYTVSDTAGQHDTAVVTVTVGVTAADDQATTPLDTPVTVQPLANDAGSGLHVVSVDPPSTGHGTVQVVGDELVLAPAPGASGRTTFGYTVEDAAGQAVTADVVVTVTPRASDDTAATTVDTPVSVDAADGLLANDGGSDLLLDSHTSPAHGTLTTAPDGGFGYSPHQGFSGTDDFDYTVVDGDGGTATATVHLRVSPVAHDDHADAVAGHPLVVTAASGLLADDAGTSLAVDDHGAPAHGTVTVDADGAFAYTPADGFSGADSFGYTVTDPDGGTSSATVRLTVAPQAVDDTLVAPAGQTLTRSAAHGVLADDLGSGLAVLSHTDPQHGTLTVEPDGAFAYTPADGWSGPDSFSYSVVDAEGGTSAALVDVDVTPLGVDDTLTTGVGRPVSLPGPGVLGNDVGSGLAVSGHGAAVHGAVTLDTDGSLNYVPDAGWSGTDGFDYTLVDAHGQHDQSHVVVDVRPAAADDAARTTVNRSVTWQPLANDSGAGLQVDHVDPVAPDGLGTVARTGDRLTFAPAAGRSGVVSFGYTVTDADAGTSQATETVTVAPTAAPDHVVTPVGTPVVLDPRANDLGTDLRVVAVDQPPAGRGTVALVGDRLRFSPAHAFTGTVRFRYTVRDGAQSTATALETVVVVADPEAAPDHGSTRASHPVTLDPLANDPGAEGFDSGTVLLRDPDTGATTRELIVSGEGTFSVDTATGSVTFTPVDGFTGTTTPVTYQVLDADGLLHVSTLRVDVAAPTSPTTGTTTTTSTTTGTTGSTTGSLQPGAEVLDDSTATGPAEGLGATGAPFSPVLPVGGALLVLAGWLVLRWESRRRSG